MDESVYCSVGGGVLLSSVPKFELEEGWMDASVYCSVGRGVL